MATLSKKTKKDYIDRIPDALAALKRVGVITGFTGEAGADWELTYPGDKAASTMTDVEMIHWIEGALAGLQATGYPIDTGMRDHV